MALLSRSITVGVADCIFRLADNGSYVCIYFMKNIHTPNCVTFGAYPNPQATAFMPNRKTPDMNPTQ
jgi:hypothetical protein